MLADIRECSIKLYRNGTAVAYVQPIGRKRDELTEIARTKRIYRKKKRKITSAAVSLWEKRKKIVQFITFTFAFDISETDANAIFTNHLKNLRTNYECKNYLWVKERQPCGRIHYHVLLDGRWIHPKVMQRAFNRSVTNYNSAFTISSNSVRYGRDAVVKDVHRLARYVSKYAGKANGEQYDKPCYAISNEISDVAREINFETLEKIITYFGKYRIYEQSYSLVIVTNFIDVKKNRDRLNNSP